MSDWKPIERITELEEQLEKAKFTLIDEIHTKDCEIDDLQEKLAAIEPKDNYGDETLAWMSRWDAKKIAELETKLTKKQARIDQLEEVLMEGVLPLAPGKNLLDEYTEYRVVYPGGGVGRDESECVSDPSEFFDLVDGYVWEETIVKIYRKTGSDGL